MLIDRPERLAALPRPKGTRLPGDDVVAELARRLRADTAGDVLFDAASRGRYATDASIYQIVPAGVFVPTSDADVAAAM
ncbi:MAG: FAD-binding oxidoreductase, partial [Rhizobacter sp.]|nr:FAD-binding oxidoreductase [Rhizobacter sp.]